MYKRYFGDKNFYKCVLSLALPIMIQNGITNFVNMLDNVMVGRVGTVEMTGVAVTNQLILVFNLAIFGALSGAGIFGAQYFGNGDNEGIRNTFRFKVLFCTLLTAAACLVFIFGGDGLIALYLKGDGDSNQVAATMEHAKSYLMIMLIGLMPYTLAQAYSSTLRETNHAVLPMTAGIIAVAVNLSLNYVLIFGHFGAPCMGVEGAAVATVVSRFVELAVVALGTHLKPDVNPFIVGAYKSFYIPPKLIGRIFRKGLPLMANETLWSASLAVMNQRYSLLGYDVVSANNICQTFSNLFSVFFISVGVAIGIILGQLLGAGKKQQAKEDSVRLITFSVLLSVVFAALYILCSAFIPKIYNTTSEVRHLATAFMRIYALVMPFEAFVNAAYFTLRSGGMVMMTVLFDSVFALCVPVPTAIILTAFTSLPIITVFTVCSFLTVFKAILGYVLVKKGVWIRSMVTE